MLKRFIEYFAGYKKHLVISCLCVLFEMVFELLIPLMMADIIDVGVKTGDSSYILNKGVLMLSCALAALVLGMLYARFAAIASQGFGAKLRRAEYIKMQSFSLENIDKFSTSSMVTRLTSDVTILQNALTNGLRPIVRAPMMLITSVTLSFVLSAELALVFLAAIPLLAVMLYFILKKLSPLYGKMQSALDSVNCTVQENLIAVRVVKSFVTGNFEKEKFDRVNLEFRSVSQHAYHFAAMNTPCFQLVMYATIVAILWFGAGLIGAEHMDVGALTGFLSYVLLVMNSLMMISGVFLLVTRSMTSAARILEVMDEQPAIKDDGKSNARVTAGDITLENVFFKYSEKAKEYVLYDVSAHIKSGQTVGIIGGTGSAKTSLVQLIPRLYEASKGRILIDGRDIKEYPLAHLRDAVSVVLQKNALFSGTIRENLRWGCPDASDDDILAACRAACASEFIERMPHGLDTYLGQGGVNVSGGQKQRLCIARALLKRPAVLIFDDSTSAVDTATEALIHDNMRKALPYATKIVISQRISSVEDADMIIVLDNGRVSQIGDHETLLRENAIYREICISQRKGVA